jgi:hypothetical protein
MTPVEVIRFWTGQTTRSEADYPVNPAGDLDAELDGLFRLSEQADMPLTRGQSQTTYCPTMTGCRGCKVAWDGD